MTTGGEKIVNWHRALPALIAANLLAWMLAGRVEQVTWLSTRNNFVHSVRMTLAKATMATAVESLVALEITAPLKGRGVGSLLAR